MKSTGEEMVLVFKSAASVENEAGFAQIAKVGAARLIVGHGCPQSPKSITPPMTVSNAS